METHIPNSGHINNTVFSHSSPGINKSSKGKKELRKWNFFLENKYGSSFFSSSDSSSSSGRLLLNAMTGGLQPRTGHMVNLVHVRSRSLSHAQLSTINLQSNDTNNSQVENSLSVEQINHDELIPNNSTKLRPTALFRSSALPITTAPGVVFTPRCVEEAIQQSKTDT